MPVAHVVAHVVAHAVVWVCSAGIPWVGLGTRSLQPSVVWV
jgi:hypothetical protein